MPQRLEKSRASQARIFTGVHERLTYKFQGRRYRLTDVHGKVVRGILA